MIEMLTGFGLLTAYLSSFVDFGSDRPAQTDLPPPPPPAA